MKNYSIFLMLLLCCSLSIHAQNKTVKISVNQADALELDASGEPAKVGDESKFELNGGTPPYSEYTWEETSEEGKTHKVTVEDANKCTVSIFVNVEGFVDIPSLEIGQKNAFPNPASDIVNVPMPTDEENVVVFIINAEGRVLYKNKVKVTAETHPLTLASCPAGRYFIQVAGKNTQTYSIIKK